MSRNEVLDENGERPAMNLAQSLQKTMKAASKVADKKATLDMRKIERALAFVELGEKHGFTAEGMVEDLRNAIAMANDKKDTRALTRLMELSHKMFMETSQNIGDQVIKLTQTQIKLGDTDGSQKTYEPDDIKRLVIEALTDTVEDD